MKKFLKSMVVMCIAASMLFTSVQGVFAKALDGEIMKTVSFNQIYDGKEQTNTVNIIVPEKYAHLDLIPNEIDFFYFWIFASQDSD